MLVCPLCRLVLGDAERSCPRDGREGVDARPMPVPDGLRERFEIVEAYAQGESGDLFLADDTKTGRRGLLKLLRLREDTTSAERARLKRELVKQATLAHPALRAPLATGDTESRLWLFREWQEGVSLSVHLGRSGALSPAEALTIASEIAGELDELHRAGLLHRDIEPGHIIVEPQPSGLPRVSLIDAGVASRVDSGTVFDVLGTPEYLSPEQASGKLVSFRSDLYALGCVLFEMLTGEPPYSGEPAALIEMHANEPPPTVPADLPSGVGTLLTQLLAKAPRERPFSAQQVKRALAPFLPEDGASGREATQAFEKLPHAPKRQKRVSPSGTLRPPSASPSSSGSLPPPAPSRPSGRPSAPPPPPPGARRAASVPPPPPKSMRPSAPSPDGTEELGALDLAQAEEVLAAQEPARTPRVPRVAKTLLGVAAPTPESTQPLSALDLAQAEEILAPAVSASALGPSPSAPPASGGLFPDLARAPSDDDAPDPEEPAVDARAPVSGSAMLPDLGAPLVPAASAPPSEPPPAEAPAEVAPLSGAPPWEASELRLTDPPVEPDPAVQATADPASGPAGGGLDYDDLAETRAFDREKAESAAASAAPAGAAPAVAPAPEAAPSRRVAKKKSSSVLPMAILGVVGGLCIVSGVGAAGLLWFTASSEPTEVASASHPSVYAAPDPGVPSGVDPTPYPTAVVEPARQPEPAVAEPGVEEPAVEEPGVEEPVEEEPVEEEPVEEEPAPTPTAQREPASERPRPTTRGGRAGAEPASGPSRLERFQAAREEALAAYRARNFPEAARAYQRATQLNARHAGSFAGLGACHMAMRQPQEAVRAYQRAVTLQPRHAGFYAALGQAYHAAGDRTHARDSYRRALAIDANNQAARNGLASVGG